MSKYHFLSIECRPIDLTTAPAKLAFVCQDVEGTEVATTNIVWILVRSEQQTSSDVRVKGRAHYDCNFPDLYDRIDHHLERIAT
ncbi:hypothetical protein [Microvirga aerophila]|uniref:Uncharacterized protein n=1 Tax=Microvirga aerophila TaxID=670291 RepID=A0A512BVZ0_9HYPH|nr:hypothetical protein [Microvirga aerophila]GEO16007.1 hypothetical protein MAE02_37030 [Microvirga aerophila]